MSNTTDYSIIKSWNKKKRAENKIKYEKKLKRKKQFESNSRKSYKKILLRKHSNNMEYINYDNLIRTWIKKGINPDLCFYKKSPYCTGVFEHYEHAIPLSRGGDHSVDNIYPSCESCNMIKFTMTSDEFISLDFIKILDYLIDNNIKSKSDLHEYKKTHDYPFCSRSRYCVLSVLDFMIEHESARKEKIKK